MTEAKIKIAHPRDWVELTPAFLQIMSFIGEGGARARIRALEYINRDLPEERLRAALVASDNTIIKMLKRPDFQGRAVCSALNPAEAVWIAPPFEEGQRVCICRASFDEWYSAHPATPAAAAEKRKLKRKPRRKAGSDRERIYNHEAITGAGNRVLAHGRRLSTVLPPIERQKTKPWITNEAVQMKKDGNIPVDIGISEFAREFERRMRDAAQTDPSVHPVGWKYIKNHLSEWGLWPVSKIPKIPQ